MTLDHAGPFRSVRLRLLPWRPKLRGDRDWISSSDGGFDLGDDIGIGLAILLALVLFPVLIVLLVLSIEVLLLLALVPFWMSGQLLGLLPWQIAVRSMTGEKHYVTVRGTRKMLEARRHYRSLLAPQISRS